MVRAKIGRRADRALQADRGAALLARLRHRWRRLQGRPARAAAPLGFRHRRAALGDRAQIPGRAGDDCRAPDRHPGRPHRHAGAGRAARSGDRRRRHRRQRHAPQRGLHQRASTAMACRSAATSRSTSASATPSSSSGQATSSRRSCGSCSKSGRLMPCPIEFPHTCPVCGSPATREVNEKTGKEDSRRRCTGELICPAQAVEALRHFVSRGAMDIEGLGAENIDLFFNAGLLKTAADIFTLKDRRAEVQQALFERREAQAQAREAAKGTTRKKVLSRRRAHLRGPRQAVRGHRCAPRAGARPLHLRARHPPHRRNDRRAPGENLFDRRGIHPRRQGDGGRRRSAYGVPVDQRHRRHGDRRAASISSAMSATTRCSMRC